MKKKLLSLFMACAMILALAVPAFASSATYYDYNTDSPSEDLTQTITIAARTFVPTVRLFLPNFTGDSLVLNPYKISYVGEGNALNGQTVANTTDPTGDSYKQVISPVYAIQNETDVKLNFAVAATATVEGTGVTLSNDYVSVTENNKKAHLMLVFAKQSTATAPTITTTTGQNLDRFDTSTYETITLKTTEVKSGTDVKYMDASSLNTSGNRVPNFLPFQFQGDMTRSPKDGWTADDKVSVTVTFTFTPESKADSTASKDDSGTAFDGAASSLAAKSYTLTPVASGTADIAPAANTFTVHTTTPNWTLVSSALSGVTITGTAPNNSVTVSTDGLKTVPNDNTKHSYIIVLACQDTNGVPRTLQFTLDLKRNDT